MWELAFRISLSARRLDLLYVCNDVAQKGNKRFPDGQLSRAWEAVLPKCVRLLWHSTTELVRGKVRRLVGIWKERGVFQPGLLQLLVDMVGSAPAQAATRKRARPTAAAVGDGAVVAAGAGEPPSSKRRAPAGDAPAAPASADRMDAESTPVDTVSDTSPGPSIASLEEDLAAAKREEAKDLEMARQAETVYSELNQAKPSDEKEQLRIRNVLTAYCERLDNQIQRRRDLAVKLKAAAGIQESAIKAAAAEKAKCKEALLGITGSGKGEVAANGRNESGSDKA